MLNAFTKNELHQQQNKLFFLDVRRLNRKQLLMISFHRLITLDKNRCEKFKFV